MRHARKNARKADDFHPLLSRLAAGTNPAFPVLPDIITDQVQVWLSFSRDLQVFLGRCFFAVLLQPRSLCSRRRAVCSCEGETRFAGVVSKLGGIAVLESRLKLRVCRE